MALASWQFDGTPVAAHGLTGALRLRFIRRFLLCLAALIALAALFAAALFIPSVQTDIAQRKLDEHPGLHASLSSLSAGVGQLEARDLNLDVGGAGLIVPSLQAQLPVVRAYWEHTLSIRRLVAKGWTLDLGSPLQRKGSLATMAAHPPPASPLATVQKNSAPAIVAIVFHQLLTGWELPPDVSIDAVELEGDILLPSPPHTDPIAVHVIVTGGGIGPGRDGHFDLTTTFPLISDAGFLIAMITTHGQLALTTTSARRPSRIELTSYISAKGRALPADLSFAVALSAADQTHGETYDLSLKRADRRVAALTVRCPTATGPIAGTWTIDARDSDLATFFPPSAVPTLATTGTGAFETDDTFARLRVTGQLNTTGRGLASPFDRVGTVTLHTDFDLTHSAASLRVDRLGAKLSGAEPIATLQSLQAFTIDETTGALRPAAPAADWLGGSLTGLPLAWIFNPTRGFAPAGGAMSGEFFVRADAGKFFVRSKSPLTARGFALQNGPAVVARDLDLSLTLVAEFSSGAWQAAASPLTIDHAGRRVATVDAKATRAAGDDQPIKITGTWQADLTAWPALNGVGRSAAGDFSLQAGAWLTADTTFTATGRDAAHTVAAKLHVSADTNGRLTFLAPLTITVGKGKSEVTAEGSWARPSSGGHALVTLNGDQVTLEHLAVLAAPFASITQPASARDLTPFWGNAVERVSFDFSQLLALGHAFTDVGGTLFLNGSALRLEGGRGVFHKDRHVRVEGAITFDAGADVPYAATAKATVDELDAALLLGPTPRGREPLLRGRFAVDTTLTGNGKNLADLTHHAREEFRLTSKNGSTNLLQTSVANSLTEAPTPVKDALGTVGSVFGTLLKTKSNILQSDKNPLSKNTEAVLNFTYATAEFRYDQFTLTAVRDADGLIRLSDLAITATNERVTGSGQIASAASIPLGQRPLSLTLQLGLRGPPAKFLVDAGLLPAAKDSADYTPLVQPLTFGGTLADLDRHEWHDLLVTAAAPQKPAPVKKSN